MSETSELMPLCHKCGSEKTIEETRKYNDEELKVVVCQICRTYDWEVPENASEDEDIFYDSENWAEKQSIEILKDNNAFYSLHYTNPAKHILVNHTHEFETKIIDLCEFLGSQMAEISQKEQGILIYIHTVSSSEEKVNYDH